MESHGTVKEHVAQNCFRSFNEGDTSLKDKPNLEGSVMEDEDCLK